MKEVNIDSIITNLDNLNIIDIRDGYLYNIGNIPGSKNIPMNFLLMNPENYLNKDEIYYLYCSYGINSKKACLKLTSMGYNVFNIKGGYNLYKVNKHKSN